MERDPIDVLPIGVRAQLLGQLIRHEGVKLRPYTDTAGKVTIGIGRNLDDVGLSLIEARTLCDADIDRAMHALVSYHAGWFGPLDPIRQAAMLNMMFNLGPARFAQFKGMIAALAAHDYETAANEMLHSAWATQTGPRARELAAQVRAGAWAVESYR